MPRNRKRHSVVRESLKPTPTKMKVKFDPDEDVVCIKDIEDCQIVLVKEENTEEVVKKEPVEAEDSTPRFRDVFLDSSNDIVRCEVNNNSGLMEVNDEILNENISCSSLEDKIQSSRPVQPKMTLTMTRTPPPMRRIHLEPTTKGKRKSRYGGSKFEAKYDTLLLDRFFIQKTLKTLKKMKPVRRRRRLKERWSTIQVDSVVSFKTKLSQTKKDIDHNKENDLLKETKDVVPQEDTGHDDTLEDFLDIVKRELEECKGEYQEDDLDTKEVPKISLQSTLPVISSAISMSIPESSALGSSCDTLENLFEVAFNDLEMFLRDERNHDAMMITIEEIVKDVAGAREELVRGGSGSDEDSVIVLSDDEYTSDHETSAGSALSMSQLRVLESCWRDWPFPSKDMVARLCSDTGLAVPTLTTWFIEKNRLELEKFKH